MRPSDRQLRTLGRMTSAGKRMTAMIEQRLDLTRARFGGGLARSSGLGLGLGLFISQRCPGLRA